MARNHFAMCDWCRMPVDLVNGTWEHSDPAFAADCADSRGDEPFLVLHLPLDSRAATAHEVLRLLLDSEGDKQHLMDLVIDWLMVEGFLLAKPVMSAVALRSETPF